MWQKSISQCKKVGFWVLTNPVFYDSINALKIEYPVRNRGLKSESNASVNFITQ